MTHRAGPAYIFFLPLPVEPAVEAPGHVPSDAPPLRSFDPAVLLGPGHRFQPLPILHPKKLSF